MKLHQIIAQINTDLIANQFSAKKFQKGRFSGIAELVTSVDDDQRQTVPAIVANDGDTEILTIDDIYPFELYHRHITSNITEPEDDFGDRIMRVEIADMLMLVMGDMKRLELNKEDITSGITLGMPLEFGSAFLEANSLESAIIIPGTFTYNREELWNAEYNTEKVMLKTNTIFMSLAYQVVTEAKVTCIEICEQE